ncbi:MAG: hypothetical protein HY241_13160 [Actinobacteria bacterium]|nr:hypothetical protein [Actinomycetota bacterium]
MAGTVVITDRSRRARSLGLIILGVFLVPFAIAVPIPFALVGAAFLIGGIRRLWLSHVLGVPTLVVPLAEPLCLGGVLVARFHRSGGTPRARRTPRLSALLVCQERVTYRQGTDDHTVTQEIYRRELAVTTDQVPDTVSGQVVIEVPVDAPPSLTLTHNRVIWSVQVRVQVPGVPDDTGRFALPVLPVVAARVVGDGGAGGRAPGAPQ